jgi:WD40 repeat protein
MVRCPACQTIFSAAEDAAPEERLANLPAPAAPAADDRLTPQPRPPRSVAEDIPWVEPADQTAGPRSGGSLEFKAVVRNDPDKTLKGIFQCRLTAEGLHMRQGRKHDLSLGVGSRATYLEGNRFALPLGGRIVEFAVTSWGVYQERLARDLCRFLKGERPPLKAGEYTVPRYLFALAVLPMGIPILTRGGALWGALGFGLAAACVGIARREQWPMPVRLLLSLLLTLLGYGVVVFLLAFSLLPFGPGKKQPAKTPQTARKQMEGGEQIKGMEWKGEVPKQGDWHLLPQMDQGNLLQAPPPIDAVQLRLLAADKADFVAVQFSPNGKTLAALDLVGPCRLWDRDTGNLLASFPLAIHNKPNWLAFSPDGKYLVAWDGKEPLDLRDAQTGKVLTRIVMDKEQPNDFYTRWTHGDFSPDGNLLAVSRGRSIKFWGLPDGMPDRRFSAITSVPGNYFYSIHFAPDGKSLMTVSYAVKPRGELERLDEVWDLEGKVPPRRLSAIVPGQIWDRFTFSPDRKLLLYRTFHAVQVFDWSADKLLLGLDGSGNCDSVALTPGGQAVLTGHADGTVRLWEWPTGKQRGSFRIQLPREGRRDGVYLAASPDGQLLAAAHGNTLTLWKLDTIIPPNFLHKQK